MSKAQKQAIRDFEDIRRSLADFPRQSRTRNARVGRAVADVLRTKAPVCEKALNDIYPKLLAQKDPHIKERALRNIVDLPAGPCPPGCKH